MLKYKLGDRVMWAESIYNDVFQIVATREDSQGLTFPNEEDYGIEPDNNREVLIFVYEADIVLRAAAE